MRNKFTMEMSICQAENGFSLDELVKRFADAFESKAAAGMLKMNLQLPQELFGGVSHAAVKVGDHKCFHKIRDNNFFSDAECIDLIIAPQLTAQKFLRNGAAPAGFVHSRNLQLFRLLSG